MRCWSESWLGAYNTKYDRYVWQHDSELPRDLILLTVDSLDVRSRTALHSTVPLHLLIDIALSKQSHGTYVDHTTVGLQIPY